MSDLIGPKGLAFDNDDILDDTEDEDLKSDPISQMNMQVCVIYPLEHCAVLIHIPCRSTLRGS